MNANVPAVLLAHVVEKVVKDASFETAAKQASGEHRLKVSHLLKDRTIVLIAPDEHFGNTAQRLGEEISVRVRNDWIPFQDTVELSE